MELDHGYLPVDEHMQVVPGVYAVGDIAGRAPSLTWPCTGGDLRAVDPRQPGPRADYSAVSRVTFTDPEVGSVGMTEQQAREAGINVAVGSTSVPTVARGWIHKVGNGASSRWWPMPTGAYWWERPASGRRAAGPCLDWQLRCARPFRSRLSRTWSTPIPRSGAGSKRRFTTPGFDAAGGRLTNRDQTM